MVIGQIDKSFQISAYVQGDSLTFALHHKTGTMYYAEQSVEALIEHMKIYANKEKQGDD